MLYRLLRGIDLFGQNVQLNLNKKYKHQTSLGGIITILMALALAGFLFSKVNNFLNQSEISVSQEIIMDDNPQQIKLVSQKFMFAVQIVQDFTDFIDNPIFLIYIKQNNYHNIGGEKRDKEKIPVAMEPCAEDHWKGIEGNFDYKKEFITNRFDLWLCPQEGQDLKIGGQFASQEFNFLRLEVADCEQEFEKKDQYFQNWNYTCANKEDKDFQFSDQGHVKFKVRFINYFINSQSKEPVQPYLDEIIFSLQPGQLYRQANIFIQDHRIKTDNKILPSFSDYIESNSIPILQKSENREEFLLGYKEGVQGRFYLRRSTITIDYDRSFLTMSDLLAYIGGSAEIIYLMFAGFALFLNQQHQLITVANSIYNFEDSEQNKEKTYQQYRQKKLQTFQSQNSSNLNKHTPNLGLNNKKKFKLEVNYQKEQIKNLQKNRNNGARRITNIIQDTLGFKNKLDFIIFHLQDYVHRIARINFNMQYIAFTITGGKVFRNSRNLQLEKAIKLANNQTDLSIILQRLSEIDKLKKLLLDKEQQRLFDFAPKPLIKVIKETSQNQQMEKVVIQGGDTKLDDYSPINKSEIKQPNMKTFFSKKNNDDDDDQQQQSDSSSQNSEQKVQKSMLRDQLKNNFITYMMVLKAKNKFMRVVKFRRKYQKQMQDNQVYLNLYQSYLNVSGRLNNANTTPLNLKMSVSQNKNSKTEPYLQSYTSSQLQNKINKELIAQMGKEMKEIFELSQILEIKYLNQQNGLQKSITEQSVNPSIIYKDKKEKQILEHSFNANTTYQNKLLQNKISNSNDNINHQKQQQKQSQIQNQEISQQLDSCSLDQYTNRNFDVNERSFINTDREAFKDKQNILQLQQQQQSNITDDDQQQDNFYKVDTNDWAIPVYAQKELNNTIRNMDSCRNDSLINQQQQTIQQQK